MIKKAEVCRDLKLIENRLSELKKANCLSSDLAKIESIIDSVNKLAGSLTCISSDLI